MACKPGYKSVYDNYFIESCEKIDSCDFSFLQ